MVKRSSSSSAVLGSINYQIWQPERHRQHIQAVADTKRQHLNTKDLSDQAFDLGVYAGKCIIPVQRHKVDGVYRLEIFKKISLPGGASVVVAVPISKNFLRAVGNLTLCK